ncbi:glycosyltransferase family 2 protein [Limosilactobacillus vaginalis]|uniref:glycosyltransferase family 2 protein n=1 Tax=Limosilactobacillus vaginalis TaxID=1633 RepID=UPI0025A3E30A|nr:glycosyltransferase family A protein [Limosilactobacillus vaginalis]MDM8303802.1 glycosyltransferase family A protein [Limosilactobacillus vaginalis]
MDKESKIDIIIPIYNCENYIRKCINSVIKQNNDNLHLILVDDGSTDKSGKICDLFSKNYSFIDTFHKMNGGVSSARNLGLKKVINDYFTFIDPDDWVPENYFDIVSRKIKKNNPDILMVPFKRVYTSSIIKSNYFLGKDNRLFNKKETFDYVYRRFFGLLGDELSSPISLENISPIWGKFYKTDLFKNIEFIDREKICSEDTWFNICCFQRANKTEYCCETYYYYNKRNLASAVNTYNSKMLDEYKYLYKYMKSKIKEDNLPKEFIKALSNRIVLNQLTMLRNITNSNLNIFLKLKKVQEVLRDPIYSSAYYNFPFLYLPFKYRFLYRSFCKKRLVLSYMLLIVGERLKEKIKI